MKQLSRDAIQRMINAGGGSAGYGGAGTFEGVTQQQLDTILADYGTKDWIDDNYLSIDFFNSLFRAKTSGGVDVLPNDGDTSTIASIKAMFGFWTDQYISALGNGSGGGGSTGALADLTDVAISNPQNNQVLAYDAATTHWVNVNMPSQYTLPTASASVLGGIKVGSTLDIDSGGVLNLKSGIATAGTFRSVTIDVYGRVTGGTNPTTLAGYGITDAKFGTVSNDVRPITLGSTTQNVLIAHQSLTGLASETWVSQNYVSIAFFNRLFQAYNGSTQVTANDTTTTIDNIKAMVGFWTEQYISALGNGSGGGSSTGALVDLTDVSISNPTDGQALVYDAATTHWKNATVAGSYTLPIATASVLGGIKVGTTLQINSTTGVLDIASGYATQSWVNTQLGSYLPLSGGTMTGIITVDKIRIPTRFNSTNKKSGICYYADNTDYLLIGMGSTNLWIGSFETYGNHHSGSTYISAGDGSLYVSKLVNGSRGNYTLLDTENISNTLSNYLPLSGGTLSGMTNFSFGGGSTDQFFSFSTSGDITCYLGVRRPAANYGLTYAVYNNGMQYYNIYHSGNLTFKTINGQSILGSGDISVGGGTTGNYLPLAGGTVTGETTFSRTGDIGATKVGSPALIVGGTQSQQHIEFDGNEILSKANATTKGTLFLQYDGGILSLCGSSSDGVIVGGSTPSYKLHVVGDIYATGGVTALSDARHKNIVQDTQLSVEQIAQMPAVVYKWNDGREDNGLHVGSIAQDWQRVLPQVVLTANDAEHTLSLQYGVAALVSAITIAKRVTNHEERIKELEKENQRLRTELEQIRLSA